MNEQEQFEDWWKQDCDTTMNPYSNTSMMYWAWEAWKAGRKAEREACAKVAEISSDSDDPYCCSPLREQIAQDIRARGQE
jgi:hypothetical protein